MTYIYDQDVSTKHYEIKISTESHYGYFEHKERGDESAGGLWFGGFKGFGDDHKELQDYDGVYELPEEVRLALLAAGYWGDTLEPDEDDLK